MNGRTIEESAELVNRLKVRFQNYPLDKIFTPWYIAPHFSAAHDDRPIGVLGQPTLAANGENRWERVADDTMCWPYGLWWSRSVDRELLAIADSGNNRVVLWERE